MPSNPYPSKPPCLNYRDYGLICLKGENHEGKCGGHLPGCNAGYDCNCPGAISSARDYGHAYRTEKFCIPGFGFCICKDCKNLPYNKARPNDR